MSRSVPNISHPLTILVWTLTMYRILAAQSDYTVLDSDNVRNISHRLLILVWTLTMYRILVTVSLPAYVVSHSKR